MRKILTFLALILATPLFGVSTNYFYNFRAAGATTNGTSWVNAYASCTNLINVAAGDVCFFAPQHAETNTASISIGTQGTAANPVKVFCAGDTNTPPTSLSNSAIFAVTGSGVNMNLTTGYTKFFGFNLSAGNVGNNGSIQDIQNGAWGLNFENCNFILAGNNVGPRFSWGAAASTTPDSAVEFNNCTLKFSNASQGLVIRTRFNWKNSPSAINTGSTLPTTLFLPPQAGNYGVVDLRGVDLSAMGSKNIVDAGQNNISFYNFTGCQLATNAVLTTGSTVGPGGCTVRFVNCDSTNSNYRYYKKEFGGEVFNESTIVRTGGASDGVNNFSRKIITTASANIFFPLASDWTYFWNTTTNSAVTVSYEFITDAVTLSNNTTWIEAEYLGTAAVPNYSYTNSFISTYLTAGAAIPTSTATWVTNGLTTVIKQAASVTFTPQMYGFARSRVFTGLPSATIYFDPSLVTNANTKAYMTGVEGVINIAPAASTSGGSFTFSQ